MAAQATKPGGLWNVRSQEIESLSLNYDVFGKGGKNINLIQDGPFWGCSPKICHTYSTVMKFGTVMHYLKKIQKIYKSYDAFLKFSWYQHFVTGDQQFSLYGEIQIKIRF